MNGCFKVETNQFVENIIIFDTTNREKNSSEPIVPHREYTLLLIEQYL